MAAFDFSSSFAGLNSALSQLGQVVREQRDTEANLAAFDAWQRQAGQAPLAQPTPATSAAPGGSLRALGQGDYFTRTRSAESSGNDAAKNSASTATGRYQFLDGTWNGLMKSNPELGLTADGRGDPQQQERAMRAFTAQNADALRAKGVDPNDRNLYMAHFLGAGAAPNFINAVQQDPSVPAASLVRPEVVAANRGVFLNQDGTPRTAGEVYARMTDRFGDGSTAVAQNAADLPAPGAAQAQGFAVPGAPQPATRENINPQMIRGLLANPGTRDIGKALWQQVLTGKGYDFQVVGDQLYRINKNAGTAEPVGISKPVQPMTVSPGQRLVDPRTGQVVYQGANDSFRNLVSPEERAAAGIQPDDKRPYQIGPDGKLSSPGGTTVNNSIDTRGETEEAKAIGQAAGKRAGEMMASASSGTKQLQRIGQLEALMKHVETGRLQPGRMSMAALGKSLGVNEDFLRGIGLDPAQVGDAQALNAITGRMVVDMIGSGGFPANNFSDADRAFITGTVPSLANDPRGNKIIMEAARRTAQIDIEKAKAWREWRKDNKNGSFDDFEVQWGEKLASQDRFADLAKQAETIAGPQQAPAAGWQDLGGGIKIRKKQ